MDRNIFKNFDGIAVSYVHGIYVKSAFIFNPVNVLGSFQGLNYVQL
jgi:hypothetical protein